MGHFRGRQDSMLEDQIAPATLWAVITVALQVMALTFFMMQRPK